MDDDIVRRKLSSNSTNNSNNNNSGNTVAEVTAIAKNLFLSRSRKKKSTTINNNNNNNNNDDGVCGSIDDKREELNGITTCSRTNNECECKLSSDCKFSQSKHDTRNSVFQRIKMKMEIIFPSKLKLFTTASSTATAVATTESITAATTSATPTTTATSVTATNAETVDNNDSHLINNSQNQLISTTTTTVAELTKRRIGTKSNTNTEATVSGDDDDSKPLTDSYREYIIKKWLGSETGPNVVMFKACSEMLSHVWYWGEISRYDAQKQLTGKPNGSFLVRDSETNCTQFTLSFRIGNYTLHYRLQYRDNYWHFEELVYESIVEMIEDIMNRSTDEKFVCYVKSPNEMQPPFPVILKYPISRYINIPQLQQLCRYTIQKYIKNSNDIDKLPIPIKLQQYLTDKSSVIF